MDDCVLNVLLRDEIWKHRYELVMSMLEHNDMKNHYLYNTWRMMIYRCYNPFCNIFPLYGARGIEVCERWFSFKNFINDMGNRSDGFSLDRIDGNGNYEPSNCRWTSPRGQAATMRPEKRQELKNIHTYAMRKCFQKVEA